MEFAISLSFYLKSFRIYFLRGSVGCTLIVPLVLLGCSDRESVVDAQLTAIQALPPLPIEPLPKSKQMDTYAYDASKLRDPFAPLNGQSNAKWQDEDGVQNVNNVKLNTTRVKGVMERYELSQLTFRGSIVSPEGDTHGLVKLPEGLVVSVQVGDYVGMDNGRIIQISSNNLALMEIIPNGSAGFIEKPNFLVSNF